jgi:uncharacterized protein affecting Mg2+/Co2+ transport
MKHGGETMILRDELDLSQWGQGNFVDRNSTRDGVLARLAFSNSFRLHLAKDQDLLSGFIDGDQMHRTVASCFKANIDLSDVQAKTALNDAFAALQILSVQRALNDCSALVTTRGVEVDISTSKIPEELVPQVDEEHMFTYRLRVSNVGEDSVQLLGRHWRISSEDGVVNEVPKGSPGGKKLTNFAMLPLILYFLSVVGYTPVLKPGQMFEYASGTHLNTSEGVIEGSFQMVVLDEDRYQTEEEFDAVVGPVVLSPASVVQIPDSLLHRAPPLFGGE